MKNVIALVVFLSLAFGYSALSIATEWEYKVVVLPRTFIESGGTTDALLAEEKTKILNNLALKKWVLVDVASDGADHLVYLKRKISGVSLKRKISK